MDAATSAGVSRRGPGAALLWAFFLGCSWTWVIGMLFPVLLVRDFGVWGWVVFAVPNVVGAAAMGFILPSAAASRRLTRQHGPAIRGFSAVTLAFHVYVACWLVGTVGWAMLLILPWLVLGAERRAARGRWLPAVAVGVAVLSWGAFSYATRLPGAWLDVGHGDLPSRLGAADAWLFLPVSALGFFFCPYLDASFHRARQATGPGTGRAAFAVGFGLVFGSMIVFSLGYAGLLRPVMAGEGFGAIPDVWRVLLGVHIGVQVAFTLSVHARERFAEGDDDVTRTGARGGGGTLVLVGLLLLAIGGGLTARAFGADTTFAGVSLGEVGYRVFLLYYGIVAPAYVLICVVPTRRELSRAFRRRVFLVTVLVALPLGFVGFVMGETLWLVTVVALIGVGRAVEEL